MKSFSQYFYWDLNTCKLLPSVANKNIKYSQTYILNKNKLQNLNLQVDDSTWQKDAF